MTRKIRREIAYLKVQEPIMNHRSWGALIDVLEEMVERLEKLEEKTMGRKKY